ncbi:MAG: recombinase family protein [Clostridia bacterium]|nr:recombinase family protein [Clostridia bacterium]
MRGVTYDRYSSDLQEDSSIEAQLRENYKYAKEHNIEVLHDYIDEERSGKFDTREQFQKMIADAKKGLFDVIIVHKIDRFARNRYDSAIYKAQLKRLGIKILYSAQHITDSPEGRLMEGILESFAEYYSDNLATEVLKGMKTTALRGNFTGGYPPLGYDIKDKKYVINEYEANIVRRIFDLYASGASYGDIFAEMKAKGYKTKFNADFGKNSLFSILSNKKYIGIMEYNKSLPRTPGHRNGHKTKAESEIVVAEGVIPQIVSKETWLKVQKRKLDSKHKAQNKAVEMYLLTGLLECGKCGSRMGGHRTSNSQKKIYSYYVCKTCGNKTKKERAENLTFEVMLNDMFSDNSIERYVARLNEFIKSKFDKTESELLRLKSVVSKLEKEINNIVNAIASGITSHALLDKLQTLEQAKKDTTFEMLNVKNAQEVMLYSPLEIKENLEQYKKYLRDKDVQNTKQFIKNFVKKTVCIDDIIIFTYCLDTTGAGEGT